MQSNSPFGTQSNVPAIVDAYSATLRTNYVGICSSTLIVADFLHTLPDEVRLMWPAPLSLPKVLFFLLRYYHVTAHSVLRVVYGFPLGYTPEQCQATFLQRGLSSIAIAAVSEGILFLRVYGFSGNSKKLLIYLVFQFLAIHASSFVLFSKFFSTAKFVKLPIDNIACMPTEANSVYLSGVFALLLASVLVVMFIMMYIAFRKHRDLNSPLLSIFYRDGILYFLSLSILAIGNIIANLRAPGTSTQLLLTQLEVDAHALLSTRMLMHLRSCAERGVCGEATLRGSGVERESGHWRPNAAARERRQLSTIRFEMSDFEAKTTGSVFRSAKGELS